MDCYDELNSCYYPFRLSFCCTNLSSYAGSGRGRRSQIKCDPDHTHPNIVKWK